MMVDPANPAAVSSVSGGVNLNSDQASIGGDVVGRDKVTQVQGDQINNYLQLDLPQLLAALKQALPKDDPLPDRLLSALQDFQQHHARLWEWKELHNALNAVIFALDQFSREVERLDATGQLGDVRALARLWRPVNQKADLLIEFARSLRYIGSPLIEQAGARQGPPWAIDLQSAAQRINALLTPSDYEFAALYDATNTFSDAADKYLYLADKQLRDTAGELYALSQRLLGELKS
ncbi:MAG TPA: hypothetical protein VLG46_09870 [Anaerolineae bacterium]|nr:hypothetical protein [Anaerolineae bacterium]